MNFRPARALVTPSRRTPCAGLLVIVCAAGQLVVGCASDNSNQTSDADRRAQAREVFAPLPGPAASPGPASTGTNQAASSGSTWSIAIANFPRTAQGQTDAQHAVRRVTTAGKLSGARLEPRDKRIVLSYGSYAGPDDPAAARDLKRVRAITVAGPDGRTGTPYANAILSPPSLDAHPGTIPQFDLSRAKATNPRALYTLQIGIYGNLDRAVRPSPAELSEIRRAAEEAVNILRRDGEPAFYYHGPTRSTVTLGTFTATDYDPYPAGNAAPVESARVRLARAQHPHNLLNGSGIRRKIPGTTGNRPEHFRLEPSFMIALPN